MRSPRWRRRRRPVGEIGLYYVHGTQSSAAGPIGYGRLGVQLAKEIRAAGVTVYDHLPSPSRPTPDVGYASKIASTAMWVSVPGHMEGWWEGQHRAIFTMWEATRLPEQFRENLHCFDTVFVPSAQNIELFSQYHPNVVYVPLGIDPEAWHYRERQRPTSTFRFLIGGSGPRKGVDIAHRAFLALWGREGSWGDGPVPTLTLKSPKGGDFYGPRVRMVSGRLTDTEELDLYANAHCYLQPSRGEGFGLQPLQAIAQGIPTILTGAHGHAAFAHLGWPVSARLVPSDYFIYGDAGDWWEPDLDEMCDQMRWVYDHYDAACAHAADAATVAAAEFPWSKCAATILDHVPTGPYTGAGDLARPDLWRTPDSLLYMARVLRRWTADIAGRRHVMEPGEDYWVPADVKRILYEAGRLDPTCEDGAGLTVEQVAALGGYRYDTSFCPTCDQQLNTGVRRQDVILAEMEQAIR